MPIAPRHPCPGIGPRRRACRNLVGRGVRCCPECEPHLKSQQRAYDTARDKTDERQFLHGPIWKKIRLLKLSKDPLCERHLAQGRDEAATLVHHKDGNELHNEEENLESLCVPCHGGKWGK